jgi:FkbM family methyltransferase
MSITTSFAGMVFRLRQSGLGAFLAKAWQRLAPSVTVTRRFYGVDICVDLRDHAIWWASSARRVETGEGFDTMLRGVKGNVWDVGCNVGVFALYAASVGNKVTAFDISPKAIALVKKSAARNRLDVNIVSQAFAVRTFHYTPPSNADTRNRPAEGDMTAQHTSITFQEAEKRFGTPAFIKLDVEYAEVEFLKSAEFRDWIRSKQIPLLVELHEPGFWDLVWQDVPHLRFSESHVLFNPLPEMRAAAATPQPPA